MMSKTLPKLALIFTLLCVSFGLAAQSDIALETRKAKLQTLSEKLKQRDATDRRQAREYARRVGIPFRRELPNGKLLELQRFSPGVGPVFYITNNLDAADTVSTVKVWPGGSAGLNLDGGGMTVGEWDGGAIYDHTDFIGRLTQMDGATAVSGHSTHVAGTLIGAGDGLEPRSRGMAYAAQLQAWDWNSDTSEMAAAAAGGLLTSNHSYGIAAGWIYIAELPPNNWWWIGGAADSDVEDPYFGYYDAESQLWDQIAFDAPYYLIVKASGNDRSESGPPPGEEYTVIDQDGNPLFTSTLPRNADCAPAGYDCLPTHSVAKNILTVGAVDDVPGGYSPLAGPAQVQMSPFSSWGPSDDGRIKPDVVGNGVFLISAWPDFPFYAAAAGTSMAAPNVTGSLLLLQEHYQDIHGSGNFMRAATLKALAIHTADEAGSDAGPDYAFGWGLLNNSKAAKVISDDGTESQIIETSLSNGATNSVQFELTQTDAVLTATLVWMDPPGTPVPLSLDAPDLMLVNDLDLRIVSGPSTYMPWVLNPAVPAAAASTGDNFRDNVEQVEVVSGGTGTYTIEVSHKGTLLNGLNQNYSLIISVTPALPTGSDLLIDEDFSAGLPAGWSVDTVQGIPWTINTPVPGNSRLDNNTGGSGNFAFVDNSYVNQTITSLRTPVLNLSNASAVVLRFKSQYNYDTFESLNVDVSTNGGSNWGNAWNFQGFNPFPTLYTLDLSGVIAGHANVMLRFRYDSEGWLSGDYWQVDDVELDVFGSTPPPGDPPGQASNPNPGNAASSASTSTVLGWVAGSDTTSHDVYFGTDSTPDAGESQGNQAGTTFNPGSLLNLTTYYWRIDEVNADGTTAGPVWSFTTEAAPVLPGVASNPNPGNGASSASISTVLGWVAGSDTTSHDVYFGTDSTPDAGESQGNQAGTTFNPGSLLNLTTYYWRIDEVNADGTTAGSVWSFTTEAAPVLPGVASNPNPGNGASSASISTVLGWVAGSDTTSHDVYFGTDNTPDAGESQGNQAGTTFNPGSLLNLTTYYWRIDEVNADGTTAGPVWSFTTEPAPVFPGVASNPNPASAAVNVSTSTTLAWAAGSNTLSHDVYFGTSASPPVQGNQTGTTFNPGPLSASSTYYWRIDEVNGALKTTGPVWSFTTAAAAEFHIDGLVVSGENVKGPRNRGVATITLRDTGGSPVADVAISGTFSGDWNGARSGTSNSSGQLVLFTPAVKHGSDWNFCVDTASKSGMSFDETGSAAFLCDGPPPPPPTTGSIAGIVTDSSNGTPIQGASVSADSGQTDTTDANGAYTLTNVPTGSHTVTFSASGYGSSSPTTTVTDSVTSALNVALTPTPTGGGTGTLKGTVTNSSGSFISGVLVEVPGGLSASTNKRGKYTIRNVPEGTQTVTASHSSYGNISQNVTINADTTTTLNLSFP